MSLRTPLRPRTLNTRSFPERAHPSANSPSAEVRLVKRYPVTPTERAFQQVIEDARLALIRGVTLAQLTAAFSAREVGAVAATFNWEGWQNALRRTEDAFRTSFEYGYGTAGFAARFDIVDPYMLREARERAANLITEITSTQAQAVRDVTTRAIYEGIPPRQAAMLIRPIVGLHTRYANAVWNFQRGLVSSGFSPEEAVARGEAYAERLRTVRSQTIARTELMTAQNEGRVASWEHAMGNGLVDRATAQKEWLATGDDRTCEICSGVNGESIAVGELFSIGLPNPPAHPDCRCVVMLLPTAPNAPPAGGPAPPTPPPEPEPPPAPEPPPPEPPTTAFPEPGTFASSQEVEDWMNRAWPTTRFNVAQGRTDNIERAMRQLNQLMNDNPEAAERLSEVNLGLTAGNPEHVYAQVWPGLFQGTGDRMELSEYWFRDVSAEQLDAHLGMDVLTGFHPVGTGNLEGVLTHEFGHVVHNMLFASKKAFVPYVRANGVGLMPTLLNDFFDAVKPITEKWISEKQFLSKYAARNYKEAFAEGFAYLQQNGLTAEAPQYVQKLAQLLKVNEKATTEWQWARQVGLSDSQYKALNEEAAKVLETILPKPLVERMVGA